MGSADVMAVDELDPAVVDGSTISGFNADDFLFLALDSFFFFVFCTRQANVDSVLSGVLDSVILAAPLLLSLVNQIEEPDMRDCFYAATGWVVVVLFFPYCSFLLFLSIFYF